MRTTFLPTRRRNISIDILRGGCILTVILLHLNIHFSISQSYLAEVLPKKLFSVLFWSGFYGVVIFFTLSGYLITHSAMKKWGSLPALKVGDFFILRFARIMPLLVVLLLLLSLLHLLEVPGFVINETQVSWVRALFAALTFHINWLEIQVGYLPGAWDILWSISIEETFYLAFPILCFLAKKEWQFIAIVLVFFVVSPWARTHMFPENELGDRNHLAFIDAIATGCIVAIIAHRTHIAGKFNDLLLMVGWALILFVLVFRSFVYQSGLTAIGLNITLLSLGVGMMVLWMHDRHTRRQEKDRLAFRWLRNSGHYSYEIYLTHMFIVILGAAVFNYFTLYESWIVPFSVAIALLSYWLGRFLFKYFTEPVNLWLRKRLVSHK